jgi:hypothetical protein
VSSAAAGLGEKHRVTIQIGDRPENRGSVPDLYGGELGRRFFGYFLLGEQRK